MPELCNDTNASALTHETGLEPPPEAEVTSKKQFNGMFHQPPRLALQFDERRSKTRYSIELGVRFFNPRGPSRSYSIGRTVNISSSGLLVASESAVREGTTLELMIEWPWPLDGGVPLQLVTTGVVVRTSQSTFALALRSYQFRTMKRKPELEKSMTAQDAR